MSASIIIKAIPSFRDIAGRFAKASKEMQDSRRDLVLELGRSFVQYARLEAPISPAGTGHFASKIMFRSVMTASGIGFAVYSPEPLTKWIVEGTKAHRIPKEGNKLLVFFWVKGPAGSGMYHFMHVQHPGTKPNPFIARAYARWEPEASVGMARISQKYVAILRGA